MNNLDLKEFFMNLSLNNFFSNVPFLGAMSILSDKDISYYQLEPIDRNLYSYILNIRNYGDLKLGEKFDVVFSKNNPKKYIKTNVLVDYLTLKKGDNIDIMGDGQGGIVRLKFNDKIPDMTDLLKQDRNQNFDKENNHFLYFTTQEVMDKILEELDRAENPIS